jgi:MOSC domain-containing protein
MRVTELWRYPVKSLRGERLERAPFTQAGIEGDRAVRIARGRKPVTALTVPRLVGLEATLGSDGEPLVDGARWDSPEALEAIRALAGADAELTRDPSIRDFEEAPILVTTDGALEALGEDRRRFRPNIVVSGVDGLAERDWVGQRLRVGPVELLVREHCERCLVTAIDPDTLDVEPSILRRIRNEFDALMGVYCEVALAGEVAQGDAVELLPRGV